MRCLSSLCTLLGYSRQAFHSHRRYIEQENVEASIIIAEVQKHRKQQPRIGTRKLMLLLAGFMKEHRIKMGRDALFRLLGENNLLIRKRRIRTQTTFSRHWYQKYPNLIKGYEPSGANQLWVSDITYICLDNQFAYLSLVTDAYSRKVVGFYLSRSLDNKGCINALKMALEGCPDCSSLIHHSDRGSQYCSFAYVDLLKAHNIKISMTEKGDPRENAIAERINGILKDELLQQQYIDLLPAQADVAKAIVTYNTLRPHSSCDMLTPYQAHSQSGKLKRHWKNYYKKREVTMQET